VGIGGSCAEKSEVGEEAKMAFGGQKVEEVGGNVKALGPVDPEGKPKIAGSASLVVQIMRSTLPFYGDV
jgi:hypothetical protein